LPKREHDAPEWQAAMQALMLVVESDGDPMLARIGIMKGAAPAPGPRRDLSLNGRPVLAHFGRLCVFWPLPHPGQRPACKALYGLPRA
jgi:hypothetical protein